MYCAKAIFQNKFAEVCLFCTCCATKFLPSFQILQYWPVLTFGMNMEISNRIGIVTRQYLRIKNRWGFALLDMYWLEVSVFIPDFTLLICCKIWNEHGNFKSLYMFCDKAISHDKLVEVLLLWTCTGRKFLCSFQILHYWSVVKFGMNMEISNPCICFVTRQYVTIN